ncbi:hypothetical protein [Dactylosporangium sp. NPDC049140]|uniref:hypothetical protein n=1 Tax=Dactylosporangium sp. NPDC049140 TaxID=3155647 RepID=UPI0033D79962
MTSPQYDPFQQYPAQPPGPYSAAPPPPPGPYPAAPPPQPYPGAPGQPPPGYGQPPAYQAPAAPAPFQPRTGVLLAIVGGLLALCVIGGTAAAFVVENGLGGVVPSNQSHRQPKDPCALLNKDAFGTDLGAPLEKAQKGDEGICDYTFQHDSHSPEASGSRLRLYVEVSSSAPAKFESQQGATSGLSRLPVECGEHAVAGHKVDPAGENADAQLWCLQQDVYIMLTFHGYNHARFSALELDEIMARIGRTALSNVPKS